MVRGACVVRRTSHRQWSGDVVGDCRRTGGGLLRWKGGVIQSDMYS